MLSTSHNLVCHNLSAPHLNSELVSSGFVIVGALRHAHPADRPPPACALKMHGQCTSPKIYPTAAMVFDESDMESLDRISIHVMNAASRAMRAQLHLNYVLCTWLCPLYM